MSGRRGEPTDRRAFLAGLATLTVVPWLAGGAQGRPAIRPGLQLYTLRREMARDLPGTLARVAAMGYRDVEFAGYFGFPPLAVRSALRAAGLVAPSAHIGMPELDRWEETVNTAATIGHDELVFAWIPEEHRSADGYRRLAVRFNRAAEISERSGVRLAYHNYTYDFARAGDGFLYDVLLRETDPRRVDFQLDVFWMVHGGADPFLYLRRHARRYRSLHVKDIGAAREMVELGRGVIDWPRLLVEARRAGVRHYFVEHDEPADPLGTARAGLRFLRSLRL